MKLHKQDIPFTMVANEVLYRTDLSLKAKGMFAYLFSKPEGWEFAADRIAREMKEARKSVLGALQELEGAGLLSRQRRPDGKVDYTIEYADSQSTEKGLGLFDAEPKSQKGTVAKGHGAEKGRISKKDIDSKKENTGGLVESPIKVGDGVNEIIELFAPVNPSWRRLFANRTQRGAVARMVEAHGPEKVRQAVDLACKVAGRKYAPTITTPVQLEERLGSLIAFARKQSSAPQVVSI